MRADEVGFNSFARAHTKMKVFEKLYTTSAKQKYAELTAEFPAFPLQNLRN